MSVPLIQKLLFKTPQREYQSTLYLFSQPTDWLINEKEKFLHEEEKTLYNSFRSEKRKAGFLIGRYCAKHALNGYNQTADLSKINIGPGVFNHPCVMHYANNENISVSISHSGNHGAAAAFPEAHPLSIDLEVINPDRNRIINAHLTDHEKKLLTELPYSENQKLTLIWTMKEALSKMLKCGLTLPLEVLEVNEISVQEKSLSGTFKNFAQYKTLTFSTEETAFSLVFPKISTLKNFDFKKGLK